MLPESHRTADDNIYLLEDRYETPKEVHKLVAERILAFHSDIKTLSIVDVGCATGEFLFYLARTIGDKHRFSGAEVSAAMVTKAQRMVPIADFSIYDISSEHASLGRQFDVVTCCGVLEIFDDLTIPIHNLLKLCKPGGLVLIFAAVNDYPIDLITRYRVGGTTQTWEKGWNYFSIRTYRELIRNESERYQIHTIDFVLPFDIPMGTDPMRTWTIGVNGKRTITCGAGLLLSEKLIEIYK